MRRTYHGKELLKDDAGVFYGLNLGYDFCAEHEHGISGLESLLGVDDSKLGIEGRKQTREVTSYKVCSFTKKGRKFVSFILLDGYWGVKLGGMDNKELRDYIINTCELPEERDVFCSTWSEDALCFVVSEENKEIVDEVARAISEKKMVIGIGADANPFSRGGLLIMVSDKIPSEVVDAVMSVDVDYQNLITKAFTKTKIDRTLKKAGKKYFALTPQWANEEKTKVKYWLNPYDQENNNWGWFTLEDLKLWAKGKGPIPKIKERA